jgi:signal transduction histidine kinase
MLYRQIHERSVDDDMVDLGQHLTSICARMNTGYLSGLGINFSVRAPAAFAPSALAHSLTLIVLELVTNAARHSEALRIGVKLSTAGERWSCTVIDDGIGLPHAFSTTSRGGLHFVGRLASSLDGRLSITSHPQKGTSMRVCFPAPSHRSVLSPSR